MHTRFFWVYQRAYGRMRLQINGQFPIMQENLNAKKCISREGKKKTHVEFRALATIWC